MKTPADKQPPDIADDYFSAANKLKASRNGIKWAWKPVAFCLAGFAVCLWANHAFVRYEPLWIVGMVIFLFPLALLSMHSLGSTICPKCRIDFSTCAPNFCHVCGKPLEDKACKICSVDWKWTTGAVQDLSETANNRSAISYCPDCGVFLDSGRMRNFGKPGGTPRRRIDD